MMISASLRVSMQTQSIENQREMLLTCAHEKGRPFKQECSGNCFDV
jgi:hypothetical protein